LNAVLRISRKANDGVVDIFRTEIGAVGCGSGGRNGGGGAAESGGIFLAIRSVGFWCGRGFVHLRKTLSKERRESTEETRMANVLGSAGCQPAAFGNLPNAVARSAPSDGLTSPICKNLFAASCRELQAGSLRSPKKETATVSRAQWWERRNARGRR